MSQFIEFYDALSELWNSSSTAYMNKTKRNQALFNLFVNYKKSKLTNESARPSEKKNTLRSNFRKEKKKRQRDLDALHISALHSS